MDTNQTVSVLPLETVEIVREGGVATIWMNRPDVFNAFNETLIDELTRACGQVDRDDSIRVVVLAGRGKHFSAGADLNWMQRAADLSEQQNLDDALKLAAMLKAIATMSKPTIARVQGAALGGGTGLAAACHIAVASMDAIFATSEVRFGIIPGAISPYVVQAIGRRQAMRYFQTAERIDAATARTLGLVHEVTAREGLDATIAQLVDALMLGGPLAQGASRSLIDAVADRPLDDDVIGESARRIAVQRTTAEAREGLAAFLGKRPARWAEAASSAQVQAATDGTSA